MTEVPAPDKVDEMRETHQRITQAEFLSLLADYQNVMETPSGIRVLRDILAFTGYRKSQFNKHAGVMAHSTGKQDVGNFVTSRMAQADTDLYCKLMIYNQESDAQTGGSV